MLEQTMTVYNEWRNTLLTTDVDVLFFNFLGRVIFSGCSSLTGQQNDNIRFVYYIQPAVYYIICKHSE